MIRIVWPVQCRRLIAIAALSLGFSGSAAATEFHVGDGQPFTSIGAVPWHTLMPGDTVSIHWRATPYREKWVIARHGTQSQPITVRGLSGPAGQRPVIDGENAITPSPLNYWNEPRSVIKIGGANTPASDDAQWIVIEGLDVRGARPPNSFTDDSGATQNYVTNAAAIHVELGEHIVIRDCIIRDSGNGLFVSSFDSSISRDILIESNYIHSNGNVGSILHHNTYTAAIGIVYQFNRFGPLLSGAGGNNLKDRSAGLVVRYNWIEGGNRQLDLVDGEDSSLIVNDPSYHRTDVYGNVLIEPEGAGNRQIIHYGGDSGSTADYRKGTLHLYHNTVVSTRTDRTTLMRLSTNSETCAARNNIIYVAIGGNTLSMLDDTGVLNLSHNWTKPGWVNTFGSFTGTINDDGTSLQSASPGFADVVLQDFAPATGSICIDAAGPLHPNVLPGGAVVSQYVRHQMSTPRNMTGSASDLGAFEFHTLCAADMDCDGDRDTADVPAFALALLDAAAYNAAYPACDRMNADLNSDSLIDGDDIAEFVTLAVAGNCP